MASSEEKSEKLKTLEEKKSFFDRLPKDGVVFLAIVGLFFVLIGGNIKLNSSQILTGIIIFGAAVYFLSRKGAKDDAHITFDKARDIAYSWTIFQQQQPHSKILDGEVKISAKGKLKRSPIDYSPVAWIVVTEVISPDRNQEYFWEVDYWSGDVTMQDPRVVDLEMDGKDVIYVMPKGEKIYNDIYGEE